MNNIISMKDKSHGIFLGFLLVIALLSSYCKKKDAAPATELSVSSLEVSAEPEGDIEEVTITSNETWTALVNNSVPWLVLDRAAGEAGASKLKVTLSSNNTGASRSGIVIIRSSSGQVRRINVAQRPVIFPSYNTSPIAPDATGMGSTAMELSKKMTMGWNIYNTMDAPGWETGWGNPKITQQLIDLVKSTGMNAIRIPCTWSTHIINTKTAQIDPAWLARVKEVVQYCFNANMYVILNTHHDGYVDPKATGSKKDSIVAKHKAIWEQIATTMRDFDEHLIFASANEPDAKTEQETATLMLYHQTFINAVRSTGGKNKYRSLVVQAPNTSLDLMNTFLDPANVNKTASLPTDPTPNKMMLEFHWYSPPQFCILGSWDSPLPSDASWGKELYFWGKDFHTTNPAFLDRNCHASTEEAYVDAQMRSVKTKFTDKGIPVIMGEYDIQYHADNLTGHPADSILALRSGWHFYAYVTKQAKVNGIVPFLWASGIFQRPFKNGIIEPAYIGDRQALDSLKKGASF